MLLRKNWRIILTGALLGATCAVSLLSPYGEFKGEVFVDIPRGASSYSIGGDLAAAGVVRTRWHFLLARAFERGKSLKAGEYCFNKAATPLDVYGRIARGDVFYFNLVVPEGRNMFEIGAAAEKLGVFRADKFVEAARDPSLIRDLDPQAPTLEGYLAPGSYRLGHRTTPAALCKMMTARFREMWNSLVKESDVHTAVTLASLVEREGRLESERPLIAAVFANRLRIGMKLDCDPTTIYAALLAGTYRGTIHQSDLERDSPYNTYRRGGLPPGPIANPGLPSLAAALHPADIKSIYFVLRPDGSGAHQFSDNLAAHEKAVGAYRRGQTR